MSPVTALIMGFTFSFAWTPCVGPALASVLLMTASAGSKAVAFALIGVYTVGFVLPFLAVGLFTTTLLEFLEPGTEGGAVHCENGRDPYDYHGCAYAYRKAQWHFCLSGGNRAECNIWQEQTEEGEQKDFLLFLKRRKMTQKEKNLLQQWILVLWTSMEIHIPCLSTREKLFF